MANIVQIKRSSVPGKKPQDSDLEVGELAVNLNDGILYSKNTTGNVIVVGSSTTSNVIEGANLYFTNVRAVSAFTAGSGISLAANGRITSSAIPLTVGETNSANADLETYTNVTTLKFDSDGGFDVVDLGSGNVKITMNSTFKNWQVAGQNTIIATGLDTIEFVPTNGISITTNTVSSPKQIGFNYSGNLNVQSDVSITNVNNEQVLRYDTASSKWKNSTITTANIGEVTNLYFTNTRAVSAFTAGSGISIAANGRITSSATGGGGASTTVSNTAPASASSGDLWYEPDTETIYLYDNKWREFAKLATKDYFDTDYEDGDSEDYILTKLKYKLNQLADVDGTKALTNQVLAWNGTTWAPSSAGTGTVVNADLTTANVSEVTNLYFTNTRSVGSLTGGSGISIASNGLITSTALGGVTSVNGQTGAVNLTLPAYTSNLINNNNFITTASLSNYALTTYVDNELANLVNSAPATLNTLNELAIALGNDASFSTTVTNSLALKAGNTYVQNNFAANSYVQSNFASFSTVKSRSFAMSILFR